MKGKLTTQERLLADAEAQLRAKITVHINTCCKDKYACIAKYIKEDAGKTSVANMAFALCSKGEGMSIQTALSTIDSDLCSQ